MPCSFTVVFPFAYVFGFRRILFFAKYLAFNHRQKTPCPISLCKGKEARNNKTAVRKKRNGSLIVHTGRHIRSVYGVVVLFAGAEEKGDTPQARYRHQSVDHSCDDRLLPSCQPCHCIEGKEPYAPPVQRTDYGENQSNSVENHSVLPP